MISAAAAVAHSTVRPKYFRSAARRVAYRSMRWTVAAISSSLGSDAGRACSAS